MKNTKQVYNIIKAIIAIAFIVWLNKSININTLQAKIEAMGYLAPIGYILAFTILPALFVPALSIVVIAGTLFGFYKGFFLTMIAVLTNTSLMYLISNRFAKDKVYELLKEKISPKYFNIIYTKDQKKLISTFFITRLIPAIPYILENYLAGLTEIQFFPYVMATFFGVIPGMLIYLNVGTNIGDVTSPEFKKSLILLLAFTVVTLLLKILIEKINGNNNNSNL
ncbi:MAG: VTT domain-containing protein [Anaerococcus sp.]|uniref:TVP38/TMEM64 family protein n=1 Tax=Anaerococcus sp. TaxID=1872515 RepID=UPI00290C7934|nr:VTT domain-containing protein [Anaerococcus sp.]MDU4025520.1 VTT domain-containing protein [Anaerococcus sp.]MDU5229222.1 VTT domain-containing protein [Anaerococcus sp.]